MRQNSLWILSGIVGLWLAEFGPVVAVAPPLPRCHAVIIGVDKYANWPMLHTAVADAMAVGKELKQGFGFRIILLVNPKKAAIVGALKDLENKLGHRDKLVVFIAGHGDFKAGAGYLAAADSELADTAAHRETCVKVDWVREAVAGSRAGHKLLILDSCFSAALFEPANTFKGDPLEFEAPDAVDRRFLTERPWSETAQDPRDRGDGSRESKWGRSYP